MKSCVAPQLALKSNTKKYENNIHLNSAVGIDCHVLMNTLGK
jgi:hypothetical protein